jgi:hypothetical protein
VANRKDPTAFHVEIGIHFPLLRETARWIDGTDSIGFEISHRLGTYRDNGKLVGLDEWYSCGNDKQLRDECRRMLMHVEAWALPWYEKFHTLAEAVAEFYQLRIDDPPEKRPRGVGPKPADPFGWAMYGWMLEALDRREEAHHWLRRAYDEVNNPLFMKDGRMVRAGTSGAKSVRHSEVEEKLAELLRQSLKLPV